LNVTQIKLSIVTTSSRRSFPDRKSLHAPVTIGSSWMWSLGEGNTLLDKGRILATEVYNPVHHQFDLQLIEHGRARESTK
jgi:hypothetical protein